LERILGPDRLRDGLRAYLKQFQFGNATWLDLVHLLDDLTPLDLTSWSRAWVEEAGRPSIRTEIKDSRIAFVQADPRWMQHIEALVGTAHGPRSIAVELQNQRTELEAGTPEFVLPTGAGLAYGDFTLDQLTRAYLLEHLPELKDSLTRGAAWVTLWEELLNRRVQALDFIDLALRALPLEDTEQNVQLILGYLDDAFWRFLPGSARQSLAPRLEQTLRSGLDRAGSTSLKSTYFSAFRSVVTTPDGIAFLERVWRRSEKIPGLTFAEPDEAAMALELAVRSVPSASQILEEQRGRFMNPDRKARFEFVIPALSDHQDTRDAWFASLADVKNRRREPWVLEGLRYVNHPLRSAQSEKYIRPALDLLGEIQRTGDIFFPSNWMSATLRGHNTRAAANVVHTFLDQHKDYPLRLRRIILQAADELFRAAEM